MPSLSPTPPSSSATRPQRFRRSPILIRLMIVNTIVILTGAVIGTVITRQVTSLNLVELIIVFSSIGILFSLGMNYWVIGIALRPVRELRQAVDRFEVGEKSIAETGFMGADPDIHRLLLAINFMLAKLEYRARLLSALSERAINAQEEERKRIARTLHDDTAQSLSTLIIQLERLESKFGEVTQTNYVRDPSIQQSAEIEGLTKARQLATTILEDLRKNIWDLRPSILDDLGLCPAIRWLAKSCLDEAGIQVNFILPPENIRLPAHLETMLFRVTQEAVNNIIRHSDAHSVTIRLIPEKTRIYLEIGDDGRGFDITRIEEQAISRKRLGLLGIQERTSLVGGTLQIKSQPGTGWNGNSGTRLIICVPLVETDENIEDSEGLDTPVEVSPIEMLTREQ